MKQLSENWLTENRIDLEYKQYILLAWLESVHEQFDNQLVYPGLQELIHHYRNLCKIKERTDSMYQAFPSTMNAIDLANFKISYEKVIGNDHLMDELKQIIDYSIPKFEQHLEEGKVVYSYIEEKLHLEPVGLIPLSKEAGYLLMEIQEPNETRVFGYTMKLYEDAGEKYRSLHTYPIKIVSRNLINTPSNIKLELIRENKELPNPATFVMNSEIPLAFEETYFPIAKRMLIRSLSH